LFGSKKKEPFTEKDNAVLELKRQRVRLTKFREQMGKVVDRETDVAHTLLRQNQRSRAILALKKKKYTTSLIEKTDTQLFNIEQMVNSIEFASVQAKVFEALRLGNTVLQTINDQMKIDDVDKLMEQSAEAVAYQNQISDMLGSSLTPEDSKAVEDEFAQMQLQEKQSVAKTNLGTPEAADKIHKRRPSPVISTPTDGKKDFSFVIDDEGRSELNSPLVLPIKRETSGPAGSTIVVMPSPSPLPTSPIGQALQESQLASRASHSSNDAPLTAAMAGSTPNENTAPITIVTTPAPPATTTPVKAPAKREVVLA